MEHMNSSYTRFKDLDIYTHTTEEQGVQYILDNLDEPALALIVLKQVYAIHYTTIHYTLTLTLTYIYCIYYLILYILY
jgi:hypothetical protein